MQPLEQLNIGGGCEGLCIPTKDHCSLSPRLRCSCRVADRSRTGRSRQASSTSPQPAFIDRKTFFGQPPLAALITSFVNSRPVGLYTPYAPTFRGNQNWRGKKPFPFRMMFIGPLSCPLHFICSLPKCHLNRTSELLDTTKNN